MMKFKNAVIYILLIGMGLVIGSQIASYIKAYNFKSPKQAKTQHTYLNSVPFNALSAYLLKEENKQLMLDIINHSEHDITIEYLKVNNEHIYPKNAIKLTPSSAFETKTIRIPTTKKYTELELQNAKLIYTFNNKSKLLETELINWPYFDKQFYQKEKQTLSYNHRNYPGLIINETNKIIKFQQKKQLLSQNLIIPSGYQVHIPKGTELLLGKDVCIISESPIKAEGTKTQPILIHSPQKNGQGLLLLNANQQSQFKHVYFKNLSQISQNNWIQTGAVVIYQSPVQFINCIFDTNLKGDDFLNIFRSKLDLINCSFKNIIADAFDGDFVDGLVKNSSFTNIGNDGIDVSGSRLKIENVVLENIEDKALSAGENSEMIVKNLTIKKAELALTSKDLSVITGDNIHIENSRLGFSIFQKKEEFGPAAIHVTNTTVKDIHTHSLIEQNSSFTLNGKAIAYTHKNVKDKLYGKEYGKKSIR